MENSTSTSSLLPRSDHQSRECGKPNSMTTWSRRTETSASNLSTSAAITPPESPTIPITSRQDENQFNADDPALRPELPNLEQDTSDAPLESQISSTNSFVANRDRDQMWKPWSLRLPLLVLTLAITLALVVVVWRLLSKSNDNQGLLFAADINDLSWWQSFSYRYLSTLLAVLYGLLWCWIDLDVRRLEPYFQLSKRKGVTAENSIFLDYPYQFIATVPIKAAKRGHWSVLASTTAFMLVSFALTPFQAGLFAVQTVTFSDIAISSYATGYTPTDKQSDLNAISAQYAYNVVWFNETPQSFMTRDYVLAAFGPDHSTAVSNGISSNFTGSTLLYSVDLDCEIPQAAPCPQYIGSESCGKSSSGCSYGFLANISTENTDTTKVFRTMYVAHNAAGWSQADYYLPETCTDRFWVSWMKRSPDAIAANTAESNSTSLFCNPTYFQQPVEATISMPEKRVLEVNPKGKKLNLPADMFNATLFEWSTASGTTGELSPDYPETIFPEQKTRLNNLPIDLSYLPPMAPFAIAANPMSDLDAYLDPKILSMSYQAAFRLLFTQQLAQILDAGTDPNTAGAGRAAYNMEVVYVVAAFAYIVMIILALIACTCCCLLVLCSRRHMHLSEDPGSIGALMKLARFDFDLIALFSRLGESDTKIWKNLFRGSRLGLEIVPVLTHSVHLRVFEAPKDSPDTVAKQPGNNTSHESERPSRPLMLRSMVGMILLAVQTLAVAALIGLYVYSCRHDGIPLLGESRFARQLVENYIPLAVATSLEAAWLVLNRLVSVLQPWEELHQGNATPSRSIDLNYGSLPPQLGLFKAYSARHLKLAAVCLMTLLANVLAVALSGLMIEDGAAIQHVATLRPRFTPDMKALAGTDIPFNSDKPGNWQGGSTLDPSYQAMSNLTRGTELLPWADDEWAYLPVELPERSDSSIFQVATPAFGVNVACEIVDPAQLTYTISAPNARGGFINLTTAIPQSDGSTLRCREGRRWRFLSDWYLSLFNPPTAARSSMATGMILSSDNASDALACQQHFFFAWIRADAEVRNPNVITSINKTVITCKATPLQSTATVFVDLDGRVKNSSDAAWLDIREQAPINEILISQANNFLIDGSVGWHSSTYPSGFTQYLMAKANESTAASIDINNPVPSFDEVAPTLERLYRKLYAILLAQNFDLLFEPNAVATTVPGFTYPQETRIYILLPAFVVSVSIISLYIVVTVWLYLQRPWNRLPRLPTTIASVIAYFAASNALRQMALHGDNVESETERKNWRWGYGTFVGPDGKSHVGIECEKWLAKDDQEVEMVPLHRPDEPSGVSSSI